MYFQKKVEDVNFKKKKKKPSKKDNFLLSAYP